MSDIKHIVAVASAKGGVGKSTTAVNLALALQARGRATGVLDADVYGPSLALMLGVADTLRPDTRDDKTLLPVRAQGLASMSMAYLASERTPMVWRGPMAGSALAQMLVQMDWGELDVLLIDSARAACPQTAAGGRKSAPTLYLRVWRRTARRRRR